MSYTARKGSVGGGFAGRNDAQGQMQAYGSLGTLFSIVNRTSESTSAVNWRLWRKAASGKKEDRVEVTQHAALVVWNKPNNFFTRKEFVECEQQHVDLTGEGWWIVGRDPRVTFPLELWPARPDRISVVPSHDEFIAGYVYHGPDGEKVPLELNEVIQLRMPNPLDPYRGLGPVQAAMVDIDAGRLAAEWTRNFFYNDASPGGIIEVDKRLGDDEFDELRSRWNEQHRGVSKAHRVAILEQGKWVERKFTVREMQLTELRNVTRETVREAFGMPKFAIGDVDDVNRATANASKAWFAEQLTVPRLERFKGALNNDFLPMFGTSGEGLEFDYDNPVPMDAEAENAERESKTSAAKNLVDAGYHPDDVAEAMGLPKMRFVGVNGGTPNAQE